MKLTILQPRPDLWRINALVLLSFALIGCFIFRGETGEDLASSYVGCRLIAAGQSAHLYSFDPVSFDEIGNDDTWQATADATGYTGALHPYVQTPLWGYALRPLCERVRWKGFLAVFTVLTMFSLASCMWLVAEYWATSFFNPFALTLVVILWAFSQPFLYAAFLMQTHMLLIFLTVAGLILAERKHWLAAGALVACAAAVKITPVFLVIYWLITRRWKSAASMLVWSLVLWGLTVALVGRPLTDAYLADLHRISRVLIVPMNNQSFAAWLMASHYSPDEMFDVRQFPLPSVVSALSTTLVIAFTIAGGFVDRIGAQRSPGHAPLGGMVALVAAMLFAPIAWTHYSVILVMPIMLLLHENRKRRSKLIWVVVGAVMLLNYRPLATDINHFLVGRLAIIRGQFYASALILVALVAAALMSLRQTITRAPDPAI